MSKVVHMLKHECLPQMFRTLSLYPFIHYSYILFFSVGQVLSSTASGMLLESLMDCEVLGFHPHCYRPAYESWDLIDMGQWRHIRYKFGLVDHCCPGIFLHRLVFGFENCVFPVFCIVSLWFPSGHIHWCMTCTQSGSSNCHCKEFRAASFEVYSLPMQLRIQVWTLVRQWIKTCWTVRDRVALDAWMCVQCSLSLPCRGNVMYSDPVKARHHVLYERQHRLDKKLEVCSSGYLPSQWCWPLCCTSEPLQYILGEMAQSENFYQKNLFLTLLGCITVQP